MDGELQSVVKSTTSLKGSDGCGSDGFCPVVCDLNDISSSLSSLVSSLEKFLFIPIVFTSFHLLHFVAMWEEVEVDNSCKLLSKKK